MALRVVRTTMYDSWVIDEATVGHVLSGPPAESTVTQRARCEWAVRPARSVASRTHCVSLHVRDQRVSESLDAATGTSKHQLAIGRHP